MRVVSILFVLCLGLMSCSKDKGHLLVNKWEEINHDMTLEINKDSTLKVKEYSRKNKGTWSLANEGKVLVVNFPEANAKELLIKELTEDSLVLSDNGLDIIFTSKNIGNK